MRRLREWRRPVSDRLALVVALVVLGGSLVPDPTAVSALALQPVSLSSLVQAFSLAGGIGLGPDKVVHAVSYAVLAGLLVSSSTRRPQVVSIVAVVALVSLFGAGIEVAQAFVPGRTASGGDLVANTVGAALGVLAAVRVRDW